MGDSAFTLTLEEAADPKNKSRIAHKSCSTKYNSQNELVGYMYSGKTLSATLKEAKLKKEKSKN